MIGDEYTTRHDAMKLLSDLLLANEGAEGRRILRRAIAYVRDTAMDLIPYGATTPNKGWDGKYIR